MVNPSQADTPIAYTKSTRGTGNRCGHDPKNPLGIEFCAEHNRPPPIRELEKKVSSYYENPREVFPSLLEQNKLKKNGERRLTRSDGRESNQAVLGYIVHYLELGSMEVAKDDYVYSRPSVNEICNKTGLTKPRFYRAMSRAKKAGLIKTKREYYTSKQNQPRSKPSVIEVTPKCIIEAKIRTPYAKLRHYKTTKLEKRDSKLRKRQLFNTLPPKYLAKRATSSENDKRRLAEEYRKLAPNFPGAYDYAMKMDAEALKRAIEAHKVKANDTS